MAQQLAPGLWRLDIPLVGNPLKNLNSYLITGERNLLIDTGFNQPACREAMDAQLREIGVELTRTDIFLTHLHSDHAGLSTYLHRPGCAVFISETDAARLEAHNRNDEMWRKTYADYVENGFTWDEMNWLWNSNPAKMAAPEPLGDRYDYLEDGAELTYGGRRLRCILTPGHTPGHLCLYDAENETLFCGDHVLFHITPNICRWAGTPDSLGDYFVSLDRVKELPVKLLPAHREETGDLRARAEELIGHHRLRLEGARRIVTEAPGLTAYEIAGKMRWSIRARSWDDFPLTQKFFAVGEALAHLDWLELRGGVVCRHENGKVRYYPNQDYKGAD